ncbi:MAG: aa3-type cytochrome oxidase subunit IV [Ktedonobacteraceae bacterium]
MADESDQNEKPPERPSRRSEKVPLEVLEQRLKPRPSIWPIALAFALSLALIGVIVHPILLFCGIALVIATIIGWTLEKK